MGNLVLWGARRGDIQFASDEDWEREARNALLFHALLQAVRFGDVMRKLTVTIRASTESVERLARDAERAMLRISKGSRF